MSRNLHHFPLDDNGDVLWRMYQDGLDLSQSHELEFHLIFNDQQQADACALFLLHEEHKISLYEDVDDETEQTEWSVTVYIHMVPTHADIVDVEAWLHKVGTHYKAEYGGWGCLMPSDADA